jgi:hypothetical protein
MDRCQSNLVREGDRVLENPLDVIVPTHYPIPEVLVEEDRRVGAIALEERVGVAEEIAVEGSERGLGHPENLPRFAVW